MWLVKVLGDQFFAINVGGVCMAYISTRRVEIAFFSHKNSS